jgi:hypothetical protein
MLAFYEEWLAPDGNEAVRCGVVHAMLVSWCTETGNAGLLKKIPNPSKLTPHLKKLPDLAGLTTTRLSGESGLRYVGLRLKTREERHSS